MLNHHLAIVVIICTVVIVTVLLTRPAQLECNERESPAGGMVRDQPTAETVTTTSTITTIGTTTTSTTTSTRTTTGRFSGVIRGRSPLYVVNDSLRFTDWSQLLKWTSNKLPRVLIYTWCTEDTYSKFTNEVYWKACYAHAHGFDIVFTPSKNFSGTIQWDWSKDKDGGQRDVDQWYSEENMWAWWHDIQQYLFSGKYDYVLMMGADTLIQESNLDFPAWAWDTGHDVTVMDQYHFKYPDSYGLNENVLLFKPSSFSKAFIEECFEFRKGFHLQGDNGPYMETLLTVIGREVEATGREGYNKKCYQYLKLEAPASVVLKEETKRWMKLNDDYSRCFFSELDRLIGKYGARTSKNIGFTPTYLWDSALGKVLLPSDAREKPNYPGPWANCWSSVRKWWTYPAKNCFAFHWNGPKDPDMFGYVKGQCPDSTFNWKASPYNPENRAPVSHAGPKPKKERSYESDEQKAPDGWEAALR
mmetsp:Transcript_47441/g.84000  ORF Transcript_47441/g.84000 Transcript_47441/m.84000 type:complete len:474 (-) Transcript_47441:75-1496(-)